MGIPSILCPFGCRGLNRSRKSPLIAPIGRQISWSADQKQGEVVETPFLTFSRIVFGSRTCRSFLLLSIPRRLCQGLCHSQRRRKLDFGAYSGKVLWNIPIHDGSGGLRILPRHPPTAQRALSLTPKEYCNKREKENYSPLTGVTPSTLI